MQDRARRLDNLYEKVRRELIERTVYDLVVSDERKYVKYNPSYQRNYIWNATKATNLVETVLINGEIPPLTVIENGKEMKIIDGRQRYETLLRFYNNKFPLVISGLEIHKDLNGLYYDDLPINVKSIFQEYRLKMIVYTPDITTSQEDIQLLERDLFRRYNYGMTALTKSEVARAKYLYDDLTIKLNSLFEKNENIYNQCIEVLLPKTKRQLEDRERKNLLLVTIREILIMPYIPIIGEKSIKVGAAIFDKYYSEFIIKLSEKEVDQKVKEFIKIFDKLYLIKERLNKSNNELKDNVLFFKSTYWMFSILYKTYSNEFYDFNIEQFCYYVENGGYSYFQNYKNMTPDNIEGRHSYMKRYINEELKLDIDEHLKNIKDNRKRIQYKKKSKIDKDKVWNGIGADKQVITKRTNFKINEIVKLIKEGRFIIRPEYQRSKIIESILLGVKLPPIYVYVSREEDGLDRYKVLDGQQRLISILKFMGEPVTDEKGNYINTHKEKYALCGLKDMEGLNGKVYEDEDEGLNPFKKEKIEKYKIEAIEIDRQGNEKLDFVDIFLRLNQNPCPIGVNTFEMWNSFDIVNSIELIRNIAKYKLFKQYGNKMAEEEMVTILAYMNHIGITIENIHKFFSVYIYLENKDKLDEHYEVKLSIPNKEAITEFLEKLKPGSKEEKDFISSINSVNDFVDKLKILSEDDESILIRIFNPNIKVPRKGNRKDFYITWMILKKLDVHIIKTYKKEILADLEEAFKLMKNMPANKDVNFFIGYISKIIDRYSKYSSKIL